MSRPLGTFNFSANFETLIAGPLDARLVVQYVSDLTSSTLPFPYPGMSVAVTNDTGSLNGLYILSSSVNTVFANWTKVGSQIDTGSLVTSASFYTFSSSVSNDSSSFNLRILSLSGSLYSVSTSLLGSGLQQTTNIGNTSSNATLITGFDKALTTIGQGIMTLFIPGDTPVGSIYSIDAATIGGPQTLYGLNIIGKTTGMSGTDEALVSSNTFTHLTAPKVDIYSNGDGTNSNQRIRFLSNSPYNPAQFLKSDESGYTRVKGADGTEVDDFITYRQYTSLSSSFSSSFYNVSSGSIAISSSLVAVSNSLLVVSSSLLSLSSSVINLSGSIISVSGSVLSLSSSVSSSLYLVSSSILSLSSSVSSSFYSLSSSFNTSISSSFASETLLTVSDRGNWTSNQITASAFTVSASNGSGSVTLYSQSVIPSAPAAGTLKIFANPTGSFSWMTPSGFYRTFRNSSLTGNRIYTLLDADMNLVGEANAQTLTNKTIDAVSTLLINTSASSVFSTASMLQINSASNKITAPNEIIEGYITDPDIISAILSGSYTVANSFIASITPTSSKIFPIGSKYVGGGYGYEAVANNVVARWGYTDTDVILNQSASAQIANIWIAGNSLIGGRVGIGTTTLTGVLNITGTTQNLAGGISYIGNGSSLSIFGNTGNIMNIHTGQEWLFGANTSGTANGTLAAGRTINIKSYNNSSLGVINLVMGSINALTIDNSANINISGTLFIGSGSATKAPMVIPSGTLLTPTLINGAIENDGNHLYYTSAGVRYQLDQQSGVSNTLQQVTTAGSSSTDVITVGGVTSSNGMWVTGSVIARSGTTRTIIIDPGGSSISVNNAGTVSTLSNTQLTLPAGTGFNNIISGNGLNGGNSSFSLPAVLSGSIATIGQTNRVLSPYITTSTSWIIDAPSAINQLTLPHISNGTSSVLQLPSATTNGGKILHIWNQNSASNASWSFNTTVVDPALNILTNLTNQAIYVLVSNGTVWYKSN